MFKKIISSLLAVILAVSVTACNKPGSQTHTKEKIKIGVLTPLTGDASAWGEATKKRD